MAKMKQRKGPPHELTDMDVQFVSLVPAGANRQTKFLMVKTAEDTSIIQEIDDGDKADDEQGEEKFIRSPRNRYGTHSSYGFKGDYAKAWRVYFSQWAGGRPGAAATGPIRGTVRRVEMIAAAKKPPCTLPTTDDIPARGGDSSPLSGTFPEKAKDYGLTSWDKADTDEKKEGIKLSCSDLEVIKRAALGEIKRRAADAEKDQKEQSKEHGIKILDEKLGPDEGEPTSSEMFGDPVNFRYPLALASNEPDSARIAEELARFKEDCTTYEEGPRAVVLERIIRAALAAGVEVSFDKDDSLGAMLPQELAEQLTKEKDTQGDGDDDGEGDDPGAQDTDMSAWLATAGQTLDESLLSVSLEQQLEARTFTPDPQQGEPSQKRGVGKGQAEPPASQQDAELQRRIEQLEAEKAAQATALEKERKAKRKAQLAAAKLRQTHIGGSSGMVTGQVQAPTNGKQTTKDESRKVWRSGGDLAGSR